MTATPAPRSIEDVDAVTVETWAVLGALACLALLSLARCTWRDLATRLRLRRRMRRAVQGERDAVPLLERAGYRVIDRQVRAALEYALDGEPSVVEVRADYLVERDGLAWIAEVKTGSQAPRITTRATRRQLLEYAHAFDVAGVLLVDPEERRVHRVSLPRREEPARSRPLRDLAILALGLCAGAALAIFLAR